MIDPLNEDIISLADAAALCPIRRGGRPTHKNTIYRWTTLGCKGVRLEAIQIGGTRCTSKDALRRFFAALTQRASSVSATNPVLQIPEDEISRRLAAEGFGAEAACNNPIERLGQQEGDHDDK